MFHTPNRFGLLRPSLVLLAGLMALGACTPRAAPTPAASEPVGSVNARIAAFARRQVAFGSVSLIPVRFERSRLSQAFPDGGRTLYCVSTRMRGRDLFESERPRIVVEERAGIIRLVDEDEEICHGHRTEPFPELDTPEPGKI